MKYAFIISSCFLLGLGLSKFYVTTQEREKVVVEKLRNENLQDAFQKIVTRNNSEVTSSATNNFIAGVELTPEDKTILNKYPEGSHRRFFAEAIMLGSYAEKISDEDYNARMAALKQQIENGKAESFKAALELYQDEDLTADPLRKASVIMMLSSVPDFETEAMEIALTEAKIVYDDEDKKNYDKMLLPVLAFDSALLLMRKKNLDPQNEVQKIVDSQTNSDIKKAMLEKFRDKFPELQGEYGKQ